MFKLSSEDCCASFKAVQLSIVLQGPYVPHSEHEGSGVVWCWPPLISPTAIVGDMLVAPPLEAWVHQ